MKWKLQPQEKEGIYQFNGLFLATRKIVDTLDPSDVISIYSMIRSLVDKKGGLDYLQVFIHEESKEKLFFIDQITPGQKQSTEVSVEDNHCTLMFAYEY